MNENHSPYVQSWRKHIQVLAGDIGPRGSTTEGERRASKYANVFLGSLGYESQVEYFISACSSYQLHLMVALLMLIAFGVYPLGGRLSAGAAALLSLEAMYCEVSEMLFKHNPLRRLMRKGASQNVFATVQPRGEMRQDLVLMGHIDSHRTPFVFGSPFLTGLWRLFASTTFTLLCLQTALYVVGTLAQWAWIWPVTIPGAVCAVLLVAICIESDLTPHSPGANDNASGAALVLTLAEHLKAEPLRQTRVWLVCTGCEEVKHYGAIDFYSRRYAGFRRPVALAFEMLGRDNPAWIEKETILPTIDYRSDPELVALAERLAAERPEWRARPTQIHGAHTEMADALRVGIPAITFVGIGPDAANMRYKGPELYWHRLEDTPDKMDEEVMRRAYAFTWAFIQALDARAAN